MKNSIYKNSMSLLQFLQNLFSSLIREQGYILTGKLRPDPIILFLLLTGILRSDPIVYGAGLSSPNAMMEFGNLKIGQTYSLKQLLGYPFKATYTGKYQVDLNINLEKPKKEWEGFEPIPDISWLEIQKDEFSLDPGEEAQTDIIITIPNEEKYIGKKYYIYIYPTTSKPKISQEKSGGIAMGARIGCVMKLLIAPKPPTLEEIRQQQKQLLGGELSVLVSPERIFLYDVPFGKKIDLKKQYNELIKIVNMTNSKVTANVSSMPPKKSGFFVPEGYEETPDYNFLKIKTLKVSIKPNSVHEIPLFIYIPEDKKIIQQKYYFVVKTEISNERIQINYHTKIYVITVSTSTH